MFKVGECVAVSSRGIGVLHRLGKTTAGVFLPVDHVFVTVPLEVLGVPSFCRGV